MKYFSKELLLQPYAPNAVVGGPWNTAGTYTFTLNAKGVYGIEFIGGGGNGLKNATGIEGVYYSAAGGSGGGFVGDITLNAGTYTVYIGGMSDRTRLTSTLSYNGSNLITITGGGSATIYNAGSGGVATIASGVIVSTNTVGSNNDHNNGVGYTGAKSNATTTYVPATASIYNGYGSGGDGNWGSGGTGYFRLTYKHI